MKKNAVKMVESIVRRQLNENGGGDQKIYNRILKSITDEFDYIDPTQAKRIAKSIIGFLQSNYK